MGGNLKPSEARRLLRRFTPRNDIHRFNLDRALMLRRTLFECLSYVLRQSDNTILFQAAPTGLCLGADYHKAPNGSRTIRRGSRRSTPRSPLHHSAFIIPCSIFDIRLSRRPVPLVRPVQLVQPVRFVRPLFYITLNSPFTPLVVIARSAATWQSLVSHPERSRRAYPELAEAISLHHSTF